MKMNKQIKVIRIFEPNFDDINNCKGYENISEGVILIDEYNRFEGLLYHDDNCQLIKGYLGESVIAIDLIGRSLYAFKQGDGDFDGVVDSLLDEEEEIPCKVTLRNFKENKIIEEDKINNMIFLLKTDKIMKLERE